MLGVFGTGSWQKTHFWRPLGSAVSHVPHLAEYRLEGLGSVEQGAE